MKNLNVLIVLGLLVLSIENVLICSQKNKEAVEAVVVDKTGSPLYNIDKDFLLKALNDMAKVNSSDRRSDLVSAARSEKNEEVKRLFGISKNNSNSGPKSAFTVAVASDSTGNSNVATIALNDNQGNVLASNFSTVLGGTGMTSVPGYPTFPTQEGGERISFSADVGPRSDLVNAVLSQNYDEVQRLLKDPKNDPNKVDQFGNSLLALAAADQDIVMMQLLLNSGARIDQTDGTGLTVLERVIILRKPEALQFLIDYGVDIKDKIEDLFYRVINQDYVTSSSADDINKQMQNILLKHGVNINKQDTNGNTMLHKAVERDKNRFVVARLLELGADPFITNNNKKKASEVVDMTHFDGRRIKIMLQNVEERLKAQNLKNLFAVTRHRKKIAKQREQEENVTHNLFASGPFRKEVGSYLELPSKFKPSSGV